MHENSLCPPPHPISMPQPGCHLPGEKIPAIFLPVIFENVLHTLSAGGENGQPSEDCPESILLTDMVRTWSDDSKQL